MVLGADTRGPLAQSGLRTLIMPLQGFDPQLRSDARNDSPSPDLCRTTGEEHRRVRRAKRPASDAGKRRVYAGAPPRQE